MSVIRQLSLFGVEASTPEPGDLAGLLLAGGEIARAEPRAETGTDTTAEVAQVSIVVNHPWRASAIVAECARRGLAATSVSTLHSYVGVRTAHAASLVPLSLLWSDGLGRRPPRGLRLDARILRLWAIAAGHRDGTAYALPIGEPDQPFRDALGAELAGLGLAAQLVSRRGRQGEECFRIVGKRRLDRLAEMVGEPPRQAPADIWPS